ncbi:MAG: hypothetical protein QXD03_04820 [Candidatus Anstonellales archaeon]
MKIHNFYVDVLRSITFLLDRYVFEDDIITRYVFNISNYSFQINYDTQYEYPIAIVSLISSTPINLHPTNIQRLGISNINRIPVIYNRTKDFYIELQEEHFLMDFNININCETPLQAKDIEFRILTKLPLNKWCLCYSFMSFISLNKEFLNDSILNPFEHSIVNLYNIFDYNTGESSYAFSVYYTPYVRLNTIDTNISSTTQGFFQVNLALSYMIPFPQYLFIPVEDRPRSGFERSFSFNNIVMDISKQSCRILYIEHGDGKYSLYKYNNNISNRNYGDINLIRFNSKIISSRTRAKLDESNEIIINRDFKNNTVKITSYGFMNGVIYNYYEDEDKCSISGVLHGKILDSTVSQDISFVYVPIHTVYDIEYDNFPLVPGHSTKFVKILTKTDYLLSVIPGINENKVDLDVINTKLKSVAFDNGSDNLIEMSVDKPLMDKIVHSWDGIGVLSIYYDNNKRLLRHEFTSYGSGYEPVALIFDPVILISKSDQYGGTRIERILIDFSTKLEPISFVGVYDKRSFENSPIKNMIRSVYQTAIYNVNIGNNDNKYFTIKIDNINLPSDYISNPKFIIKNNYYTYDSSVDRDFIIIDHISNNSVTFSIDKIFFLKYFRKIDLENPLFIWLVE